jgi:hypothetical protein
MEKWKNGITKDWLNGEMGECKLVIISDLMSQHPSPQYTTIPLPQLSIHPLFHHSNIQLPQYPNIPSPNT